MDRFARLVARVLDVPHALVSVMPDGDALGPELVGIWPPGPLRNTSLARELCRRVVSSGAPLALADLVSWRSEASGESAAADGRRPGSFLGVPLTGRSGEVLGAVGAFGGEPRTWSERNVQDLSDLAAAHSAELRERAGGAKRAALARRPDGVADGEPARHAAGSASEEPRRLQALLGRSQLLLRAAEVLADTTGLDEVRRRVNELVSGDLEPAYVGLSLLDDGAMRRTVDPHAPTVELESKFPEYALTADWPSAQAARERRLIVIPDRETLIRRYSPDTVAVFDAMGLRTAVCVPLPGALRPALGALVVAWDTLHEVDVSEQAVLMALGHYTARAVERALFLDGRVSVVRQLQQAMLTDLPVLPGLDLAALYRPAASHDMVGGDWYDAYPLGPAAAGAPGAAAVTVGDITGHNARAAALMGQARSMLRQADHDHRGRSPAMAVRALEHASADLEVPLSGTLVHAHLTPRPEGCWLLEWTNAGHPAPLLAVPGAPARALLPHDRLIHPTLPADRRRTSHRRLLTPGSVLLLYTDGLVEHRGRPVDESTDRARRILAEAAATGAALPALLHRLADTIAGAAHSDDIALLAVRVPTASGGSLEEQHRR
ncbi:SpoIIE family protein phosphatase [Streptomyces sp. NPDC046985]|uniref:SpoIIE family protein phosphatase n=1 Tax=Streptomyces sp. NPDC046985 TaxID=3155377 RepID=UPI0033D4952E